MNLPNKLTILRVLLIPVFVAIYLAPSITNNYFWALVVFGAASFTDLLDGMLARKHGLVTDFGRLMDPLADKLLIMAAVLCLLYSAVVHPVVVIVLLGREFLVTSIRLVAAGKGVVIAADKWGKLKTAFQIVWICFGLLFLWLEFSFDWRAIPYWVVFDVLTWVVLALTALSGLNYLVKNRYLFADK